MSTDTGTPPAPAPSLADGWTRRDRVAGWILLLTWTALVVAALVTGERASTFGHLERLVATGEVTTVEVVGEPLPDDSIGYAGIEVRWREGWTVRSASVTQASNERQAAKARRANGSPVVVGGVEDHLRALDPGVTFTRGEYRSSSFEMRGLQTPGWVGLGYLVLLLGTLVLVGGPRPWRASRWGWAWLVLLLPPFGIAAYLLLGGPTGLFRPRDPRRVWLTGGWAFLLTLLLGGGSAAS
jgi:hypothetical protein